MPGVLSFPEARHAVERQAAEVRPCATETLPLLEAGGRVLAESVAADRDFPPFPRATRDGYAVRAGDVASVPVRLQVVGEVRAGISADLHSPLAAGECVEIMTGAPVPAGADAVVMVEHSDRQGADRVEIRRQVEAGENVVPRGSEACMGDELLSAGMRLLPAAIAAAASAGKAQVTVYAKPRVAVLATGDELVDIAAHPAAHQIRNSNSYSLAAQVLAAGGRPLVLPVAADHPDQLRRLIARGLSADLLLITGGVSAGKYDLVEPALAGFGAEFFFTGVAIQPGKPTVFGRCAAPAAPGSDAGSANRQPATGNWKLFLGLPGNPVSTMVGFELFVRPVLDALAGATPRPLLFSQARLKSDFTTKTGLTRFLPAALTGEFERGQVEPLRWHGSGDIAATARADCYLVVPPDRERLAAGELVSVLRP